MTFSNVDALYSVVKNFHPCKLVTWQKASNPPEAGEGLAGSEVGFFKFYFIL